MSKTGDNLKASLKEAITIEKVLNENSALKAEISRLKSHGFSCGHNEKCQTLFVCRDKVMKAEDKATKLEADIARKDELLERLGDVFEGDDGYLNLYTEIKITLSPDPTWLKRKLAEERAKVREKVYRELIVYFGQFADNQEIGPKAIREILAFGIAETKRIKTEAGE